MKYIDKATFRVVYGAINTNGDGTARFLRCASLLKPLYVWSVLNSPIYRPYHLKDNLAINRAVRLSCNNSTTYLWDKYGQQYILNNLNNIIDDSLAIDKNTWGSILINADQVAKMYAKLISQDHPMSHRIFEIMQSVPNSQTFGLKKVVEQKYKIKPAIKAGWYMSEDENFLRTHVVTLINTGLDSYVGTVILTAIDVTKEVKEHYQELINKGQDVKPIHKKYAAEILRDSTIESLELLSG